jgi:molybdate-binding protein/DNA-binding XRE family transcriptional regulator
VATIDAGRLAGMRAERGLSQRTLADAAGITRQAVGAIEAGRMQPSVGIALALARALGTTVEDLFARTPPTSPPAARVAVGTIGGRSVAHALEREHLAFEPAQTALPAIFIAGCDAALGLLTRHAQLHALGVRYLWLPMTNRDALAALARGRVHVAAVHEPARRSPAHASRGGERFAFAASEEGWLVRRGNPLRIRRAADLVRSHARLVNRPRGAGARQLLDGELRRHGIDGRAVAGYDRVVAGQLDAGRAVAHDFADAAVGLASIARMLDLDFVPLREERCTLAFAPGVASTAAARTLLVALGSTAFRRDLAALGTYDVTSSGEQLG